MSAQDQIDHLVKGMLVYVRYRRLVEDVAFACGAGSSDGTTRKKWLERKRAEIAIARECIQKRARP